LLLVIRLSSFQCSAHLPVRPPSPPRRSSDLDGPGDRLAPADRVRVSRRFGAAAPPGSVGPDRVRSRDRQPARVLDGYVLLPGADAAGRGGRGDLPDAPVRGARPACVRADPAGVAGGAT